MKKWGLIWPVLLIFGTLLPVTASAAGIFNDTSFATTWERVDKPVQNLAGAGRSYTWGPPAPASEGVTSEPYNGGTRKVQYFDKARMEVNNPAGNPTDLFYVTTGLLVKELVTGNRQDGDNVFTSQGVSQVQVAGDSNENGANASAPTYASFQGIGTFSGTENSKSQAEGGVINNRIDKAGEVSPFTPPEQLLLKGYDQVTQHNIADVFTDYSNLQGLVWNGQNYVQGAVFFGNAVYIMGRPITEPYWVRAVVAGTERDVLVQLFERRVLTYTPSNPDGFKVEMGNVGQHYYRWRYSQSPTRLITTHSGLAATAAGNYIFWQVRDDDFSYLYGYDLRKQSQFLIAKNTGDLLSTASDGKIVAWLQSPFRYNDSEQSIQGYDLATRKSFEIVKASHLPNLSYLSMDQGFLYYLRGNSAVPGFYSHNLATDQEKLLTATVYNRPVVKDGILVWQVVKQTGEVGPSEVSLHLLKTAGSQGDTVFATGINDPSNYSISGDNVVWNFYPPELKKFYVYGVSSGKTQTIVTRLPVRGPIINGDKVALVFSPDEGSPDWSVGVYNLKTGSIVTVARSNLPIMVWGMAGSNGVVYSITDQQGMSKLYFTSLSHL